MLNFKTFYEANKLRKGDTITNSNPDCDHFKSKGVVTKVKKLKDNKGNTVGNTICYKCTNSGKNWKKNEELEKTEIQLKKSK